MTGEFVTCSEERSGAEFESRDDDARVQSKMGRGRRDQWHRGRRSARWRGRGRAQKCAEARQPSVDSVRYCKREVPGSDYLKH